MRASKSKKKLWFPVMSPLALLLAAHFAQAGELDVSASVEAETVLQNRHSDVRDEELLTLAITPEGSIGYQTRTFSGYVTGSVTQMERDSDDVVRKDTYFEYNYEASWEAIDNVLSLETRGGRRFLDGTGANFLISDYFMYAEELVRVDTQSYTANLTLPEGDYVAGRGSVNYSTGDASESEFQTTAGFNSDNISANLMLMNGNDAQNYFWNLSGMYTELQRDEQLATGDYSATYVTGSTDALVTGPFGVRVTASYDSNELTDRNDEFSNKRDFKSYGVGLVYREDAGHYVAVTANKVDSDVERDDGDVFVGVDAVWALTPRTNIQANYGRRFYGKSASASLNYASRKIRGAVRYTEEVTSFSQLTANPQVLGVIVCPLGEVSADVCYYPSSLDYTPAVDEQKIQIMDFGIEALNRVFLRKSAISEFGLQGRRSTVLVTLQYADDNFLEIDRQRTTYMASVNASYELGRTTTLTGNLRYGNTEQDNAANSNRSEQWMTSLGLDREFGKHISAGIEASYLTRSGTLATSVYGADYDERRITLTVRYDFD